MMAYEELELESKLYRGKTPELSEDLVTKIFTKTYTQEPISRDHELCPDCKVKYQCIDQYNLVCPSCSGYTFVGVGAEISGGAQPSSKNDEDHILTQLKTCNDQKNGCIPSNIIHSAYQLLLKVKSNGGADKKLIWRGDVLRGLLAACVSLKCQQAGIAKDDQFFCDMMSVKLTKITAGRTILMNNEVKVHRNTDPSASYIANYLEKLSLSIAKYQPVLLEILNFCKATGNVEYCKMQTPTKCIGVICVMCQLLNISLTHAQIIQCKKISKATYTNCIRKILALNIMPIVDKFKKDNN